MPSLTTNPEPTATQTDHKKHDHPNQYRHHCKRHRHRRPHQHSVALTSTRIQPHQLEYQLPESFLDTMPNLDLWSISVVLCSEVSMNVSDLPKITVEFPQSNATVFSASGNMWHILGRIREHNHNRTRYKLSIPLRVYSTLTRFLPLPLRAPHAFPIPLRRGGSKVFFDGPMVIRIERNRTSYVKSCQMICDVPVPEKTKQWFSTCETLFYSETKEMCSQATDPDCFEVWTVPQTQISPPTKPLLLTLSSNQVQCNNGAVITKEIYHCADVPLHVAMTGIKLPSLDDQDPCIRSWVFVPPTSCPSMRSFQGYFQLHKSQQQPKTILDNLQHMNQISREMMTFTQHTKESSQQPIAEDQNQFTIDL